MNYKICNVCNEEKELSEFYFRKDLGKHKNRCKRCCIDEKNMVRSPTHKVCKHCGEEKLFSEYQKAGGGKWLQPYCKSCDSIRKSKWDEENKDVIKQKRKSYYLEVAKPKYVPRPKIIKTKEDISKRRREYANRPEVKAKKYLADKKYRESKPEIIKANREKNKASALVRKKAWQKEMMSNVEFRIKKNLRGRVYVALKRNIKTEPTMKLLGCSVDYFKFYFQFFFVNGMTWEKYMNGEIVIDHIKPCVLFDLTKDEEQKQCFHYKNLQPLWKLDNLKKGAKLNYTICQEA